MFKYIYFSTQTCLCSTEIQSSEERIMADNNRNWSLVFAQFSWLVLVQLGDVVSMETCQAFGAITHLAWLCVFMWTGI